MADPDPSGKKAVSEPALFTGRVFIYYTYYKFMKITALTSQQKDQNRINVMVDGKYHFSLAVPQVIELGIKIGNEYTEQQLLELETESQFGKVYTRALEYCFSRPHSAKEVRDYLYRKTRDTRTRTGETRKGVSMAITQRVFDRLVERGYINDESFARFWLENRHQRKGASRRKLVAELRSKGVESGVIERLLTDSSRNDRDELQKIIVKKRARYSDEQKLVSYLARQGFSFDDIREALADQQ